MYYTNLIAENNSNQRNLLRATKSLLCEPSEVSFPKDRAPDDLANDFGNFFMQKIDKINQLIDMQSSLEMRSALILIRMQVSHLPILKRCLKSKSLNLVPRVLRLFGQRLVARRDSGDIEFYYHRISAV